MRPIFKNLALVCAGSMLLACAGPGRHAHAPSASSAEENYLIGRGHHLALRPQQALAYYQAALRAAPGHVSTLNGMAVLHGEQGRLNQAIAIWENLAGATIGSESAYLLVNLGHAYVLRGETARGQELLEQACLRDPLNPRAWEHLGQALEKMGQPKRAQAMLRQAAALRRHDIQSDYAVARAAGAPPSDGASKSTQDEDGRWARTEIIPDASGTLVVRRIEPAVKALASAAPANFGGNVLFEISNGNGVTGMARAVSREVAQGSAYAVRLSNQKGFSVRRTRVEYKVAFKNEAERLAGDYGGARVVQVGKSARADIRLVLGRDLLKRAKPVVATVQKPDPKAS